MKKFKVPERFWSKVDVGEADECWEWLAGKSAGYGAFWIHYKVWVAHRVAWILTYGKIPDGLLVCHTCDNPLCCNPYHLFLGTNQDNTTDAVRKGRKGKLTEADVLEIRERYAEGGWSLQELADAFDVTRSNISRIVRRETWNWLVEEEN